MKLRLTAAAAALLALLVCGCAQQAPQQAPELLEPVGLRFDTARVERGDVRHILCFPSAVTAQTTELYYEFDGVLDEMHVRLGQQVQADDLLVSLDVSQAQEQLDALDSQLSYLRKINVLNEERLQLEAEVCQAELEQLSMVEMPDSQALRLKQQELERKQADYKQEKERQDLEMSQLRQKRSDLQQSLERSTLRAPFAGTVVYVNPILSGEGIQSLQTQVVLMDESVPILSGDFVSDSYLGTAVDLYAMINGRRYDIAPLPYDRQEYISLVLSGQTVESKFSFSGDASGLQLGDYAVVFVVTRQSLNTLHLPVNTLYRDALGYYVYKVADGQNRERVQVEVGLQTDSVAEILSGLNEGDEVYVKE